MIKTAGLIKRVLVGRPKSTEELNENLLPKTIALPIFSSDPLSSVAYATQEILLVLGTVGVAALTHVIPISLAIAVLLATVVASYRQVCLAYPNGGGSYVASKENLGMYPGLVAASALLVDYVMTVAVSTVAGVDAIVSAQPGLLDYKVEISVVLIALVTVTNLRGVRESGAIFAAPTYLFIASILLLVAVGFVRCVGGCPQAESVSLALKPQSALTWFLILRAFSAGTTALTGTEAISNGVPAFRPPKAKNAATTLLIMALIAITMFLGISILAVLTNVHFTPQSNQTVVAQIAVAVFGKGFMFYLVQAATALVLILAANTAFNGLPRLTSVLAGDKFLPRQFLNLGDRLVYSNGIVILATVASALIWIFRADVNRLIQLYLIGVFVAFTLSQIGLVVHWRRTRGRGWRRRALLNGFGGALTGVVLVIVLVTKFAQGAWMVTLAIPALVYIMVAIHRHLLDVARQLREPWRRPVDRRPGNQHVVILVTEVNGAARRALAYVKSLSVSDVSAITFDDKNTTPWKNIAPGISLDVLAPGGSMPRSVRDYVRGVREELGEEDFLTVIVPEILKRAGLFEILGRSLLHRVKAALLTEPGIQVLDIPVLEKDLPSPGDADRQPSRNHVVILLANAHNATLQAIEYAETLRPTSIRAVSFGLVPEETEILGNDWLSAGIPHLLEIEDSPFRDIGRSIVTYVRRLRPDGVHRVVTVILPEFVVPNRRQQILHGQTALLAKRHLLFEKGVVVVSVPYHLQREASVPSKQEEIVDTPE